VASNLLRSLIFPLRVGNPSIPTQKNIYMCIYKILLALL
jgi:hypothetical protein